MKKLLALYQSMLRIRLIEEAIADRYSEQKMRCPTHLSIGQEAVAVGVSSVLGLNDKVYSSHRAHAHYLAKGGSLNKLIAELYGKETGCTGGRGGSMHLCDLSTGFMASTAIVANSIPLAVGHALALKAQKSSDVSVTYFGEGATEEGAFYESLNFAVLKSLPVLFVCENNQYSVYSPLKVRQPNSRNISALAKEMGAFVISVDGNDAQQVAEAASQAIQYIQSGQGPAFLECHTYRHREHCGPNFDDDLGYRPEGELAVWLEKDPVLLSKIKLKENITDVQFDQIRLAINDEIESAFEFAENSSFPNPLNNEKFVYAE